MARRVFTVDGPTVERLRKEAGYERQADLAAEVGLAPATVSRIERLGGSVALETAEALARALGVGVDALRAPVARTGDGAVGVVSDTVRRGPAVEEMARLLQRLGRHDELRLAFYDLILAELRPDEVQSVLAVIRVVVDAARAREAGSGGEPVRGDGAGAA
jgi:transcriptional regulator with XRE-family HTH domain